MRKLLLATTAALGATIGIAGGANAGTLTPNAPNPAPGSITVTFNAVVEAFVFNESDTAKVRAESNPGGGTKSTSYGIGTYSRLFPSFDGVLANGLKYGASIEIRHRSGVVATTATSNSATSAVLYNQREFMYLGADKFGKLITWLARCSRPNCSRTGNPANFNTGGWDGDLPGIFGSRHSLLHRRRQRPAPTRWSMCRRSSPASISACRSSRTATATTSATGQHPRARVDGSAPNSTVRQYGSRRNTGRRRRSAIRAPSVAVGDQGRSSAGRTAVRSATTTIPARPAYKNFDFAGRRPRGVTYRRARARWPRGLAASLWPRPQRR